MHMNKKSSTVVLSMLACFLWSTAVPGIKIGLRYSGPFAFAGIRFILAGLMLTIYCWKRWTTMFCTRENLWTIIKIAFFQTFLLYGLFYLGVTMVPGALAAIIIGSSPLIAAIMAHFMMANDSMTLRKVISLSIGMGGVIFLSVSRLFWTSPTGLTQFCGIIVLLAAIVSSTYGNILVAKEKKGMDPVMLNAIQLFLGGFFLLALSLPIEGWPDLTTLPLEYYGVLFWLAALSAIAFSLWFTLLKRPGVTVSQLNLWKFIIPVCGALLSWLILPKESANLVSVIGMLCIASSIVFYYLPDIFDN